MYSVHTQRNFVKLVKKYTGCTGYTISFYLKSLLNRERMFMKRKSKRLACSRFHYKHDLRFSRRRV
jgi:hypothetical protein